VDWITTVSCGASSGLEEGGFSYPYESSPAVLAGRIARLIELAGEGEVVRVETVGAEGGFAMAVECRILSLRSSLPFPHRINMLAWAMETSPALSANPLTCASRVPYHWQGSLQLPNCVRIDRARSCDSRLRLKLCQC
jgi:hypothetical protein